MPDSSHSSELYLLSHSNEVARFQLRLEALLTLAWVSALHVLYCTYRRYCMTLETVPCVLNLLCRSIIGKGRRYECHLSTLLVYINVSKAFYQPACLGEFYMIWMYRFAEEV